MPKTSRALRLRQLDQLLTKYKDLPKLRNGYIHEIRNAFGMSANQLAKKLGITQQAITSLESNEKNDSISLKSLERAAQALGCKLVYALVPETSLQQILLDQARSLAIADSQKVFRSMGLESQSTSQKEQEALLEEMIQERLTKPHELWK